MKLPWKKKLPPPSEPLVWRRSQLKAEQLERDQERIWQGMEEIRVRYRKEQDDQH